MVLYIISAFSALLAALFFLVYKHMTRNFGYFSSRGVMEMPPSFPYGSEIHKKVSLKKISPVMSANESYKLYKDRVSLLI